MRENLLVYKIDWLTIGLYASLIFGGWLNIYAADFDPDSIRGIFSLSMSSGRQLIWIGTSAVIIALIMLLDYKFYHTLSYVLYGIMIFFLLAVLIFGEEVAGSKSWFELGSFKFQPSEFTKFATGLALARYLSKSNRKTDELIPQIIGVVIFLIPFAFVVLQGDLGTAMVFLSLILVMFREGMHPVILIVGIGIVMLFLLTILVDNQMILFVGIVVVMLLLVAIMTKDIKRIAIVIVSCVIAAGFIKSVDFILSDVLKPHQQKRVMSLINPNADPLGIGWNVTQSKIAIGSGGFTGKGYLEGTQTKFDFVPAQTTDFIFCTIGEEHGWIGSFLMIAAFCGLFLRLVFLAERQKSVFARVYGYSVMSILFFHFALNIAMTIGLFPVIGIPLPFLSYGGSSLWGFTILLFIFLKLDAHRMQVLQRLQ
ncbi:MAG: rod shape-determining protein RodA [Cyclobacteriaceae bacterium]